MVVIRLARGGSKHRPFFHVVVADSHNVATAASSSALASTTLLPMKNKSAYASKPTA